MANKEIKFPNGFKWGTATASAQIEGASKEGGKGLTNWDVIPLVGGTYQEQTPDQGCDHYYKFKEDIKLMAELGINVYRFSISWARIIPEGVGEVSEEGLKFYEDLIDELLKYGIEPYVTLFHWDYPMTLQNKGGWLNPDSPTWFLEYIKVVLNRFSKKVKNWMTINEPANAVTIGGVSFRANYSTKENLEIIHNMLKAHGLAAQYIHECGGLVGYAPCSSCYAPLDENNEEDIKAAKQAMFAHQKDNVWNLALWVDPIVFGKYPKEYYEIYSEFERPNITEEDMKLISTPIDFLGMNIYTGDRVKRVGTDGYEIVRHEVGNPQTSMEWEVYPRIIYWVPKFIYERYQLPFYITENGCAVTDIVSEDKKVHDGPRVEYLKQYLKQFALAIEEGVDARGYFLWSFMDNFEWFKGYSKRFGIVYVNYQTKERIKKDSFEFYKETISKNGRNL